MTGNRFLVTILAVMTVLHATPALAAPLTFPTHVEDGFPVDGPPSVTAASWILYDESSDTVLASFLPNQERAMASVTKIMTALLAFERGDMNDLVTISRRAADTGEREIDLVAGEQLTLGALVRAAMIHSANDAATAIAEHIGGSVEGFVDLMNQRALQLGLTETSFANPHGLDAPNHYSSARDLLDLARAAMAYEEFRDIVRSRVVVFPDGPDGSKRRGTTTNLTLGEYEGMSGIKTGFTSQALLTFVATAERDGRRLYAVVLGSEGRRQHFADAEELFDYGFEQLGIYGSLSVGTPYVSREPRIEPNPLLVESNLETFVHLSSQGLLTTPPGPTGPAPAVEPTPVTVVNRQPEEAPESILSAFAFWWRSRGGNNGA
ncbi:MAG: D-alanyl-D-alanine carboxypeptidase family protein [Acidimicrobiia bacterium]